MQSEEVGALCAKFKNDMAPDAMDTFAFRLADASEEAYSALSDVKLKNRKTAILLNILLGGYAVGRFYLGDIKGGIFKLIAVILINAVCGVLAELLSPWILIASLVVVWGWYVLDVVRSDALTQSVNTAILFNTVYATYLEPDARRKTRAWKSHAGYDRSLVVVDGARACAVAGLALAPFASAIGLILSSVAYVRLKRQGANREIAIAGIVFCCLWAAVFVSIGISLLVIALTIGL